MDNVSFPKEINFSDPLKKLVKFSFFLGHHEYYHSVIYLWLNFMIKELSKFICTSCLENVFFITIFESTVELIDMFFSSYLVMLLFEFES